ncbi:MAG: hypothetical protein CVV27_06495 [Candidatus Melainabacteria bacterium HGW-Melainabacteria-1]|nr:MAG: hypothetical protein CVV27_06495 [Candidatus Melainabacteria bacterium HGW-Melainabacteria-1]
MRRILILGASRYYVPIIRQLQASGRYICHVCDRDPAAQGATVADAFHPVDISDAGAVLRLARGLALDGVMPVNDFGVPTAAKVAGALGLPGLSERSAALTTDKPLMRQCWQAAGLPIPAFRVLTAGEDIAATCAEIGFPCVLKPDFSGGGARGVSVIACPADIPAAIAHCAPHARGGRWLVEAYLDGLELSAESVSIDGHVHLLALGDKQILPPPGCVTQSIQYPAALDPTTAERVREVVAAAVLALGIREGFAHTELRLVAGTPYLLETGARGGGGHIFHTLIEAVSGVAAPLLQADLLCGDTVALSRVEARGAGCYRFVIPPPGRVVALRSPAGLANLPGVVDWQLDLQPGDLIRTPASGLERAGFIVTLGRTRDEAVQRANQAEAWLEISIAPEHTKHRPSSGLGPA